MNRKGYIDIAVCCFAAAAMVLCFTYMEKGQHKEIYLAVCGFLFLLFLILAFRDFSIAKPGKRKAGRAIQKLILLDEEGNELSAWHIGGKTSVLIGRNTKKESVDVNLQNTEYGALVDCQHAVLNYAGGQWFIEDLGSRNGIRIEKKEDGKLYQVSDGHLCRINTGDILYIANTRLKAE